MTKKDIAWLSACIILALSLVVTLILGLTGYFSSVVFLKSNSDLVVGDTVVIKVQPNQCTATSFTFDGAYLPNETIPQIIQITAEDLEKDVKIRVKAEVFGSSAEFYFTTSEHFDLAADGYYYYDDILQGGNKITFCTSLVTPEESDFVSGEKYILSVIVETLEEGYAQEIWG